MAPFRVNVFYDRDAVALPSGLVPAEIPTLDELKMPPIPEGAERCAAGGG